MLGSLTRPFSGQSQTVNIRGLTIIVSLMKLFLYIVNNNVYHNLVKRTRQDITYIQGSYYLVTVVC